MAYLCTHSSSMITAWLISNNKEWLSLGCPLTSLIMGDLKLQCEKPTPFIRIHYSNLSSLGHKICSSISLQGWLPHQLEIPVLPLETSGHTCIPTDFKYRIRAVSCILLGQGSQLFPAFPFLELGNFTTFHLLHVAH